MSKDQLLSELEVAEEKWILASPEGRAELLSPFANALGVKLLVNYRFEMLPEALQLMLAMFLMSNDSLDELAVKEGYLCLDTRTMVHRNSVIAAVAGSIIRGSTATETSAYRRTGTTKWFKKGSSGLE